MAAQRIFGLACTLLLLLPPPAQAQSVTGVLTCRQGLNGLYASAYHDGFVYFGTNTQPGHVSKVDTATFTEVDVLRFNTTSLSRLHTAVVDPVANVLYLACVQSRASRSRGTSCACPLTC